MWSRTSSTTLKGMVRVDSLALLLILGEIHCLSHLNMMLAYSLFVGALCQVEEIQLLCIYFQKFLFIFLSSPEGRPTVPTERGGKERERERKN